jgi:hypothetical protein
MMVTELPVPQFEVQGISNIHITGLDTTHGANVYSKVDQVNAGYMGALRQEFGTVFFLAADSTQEHVLYNFDLLEGDTAHDTFVDEGLAFSGSSSFSSLVDYTVLETGQVDGRKWLRLQQLWGGPDQYWIEGFGSPYGLFSVQDPINVSGYWNGIWCMSHLDTSWVFSAWEILDYPGYTCETRFMGYQDLVGTEDSAYPNPTTGPLRIDQIVASGELRVLDAMGRFVQAPVSHLGGEGLEVDLSDQPSGIYQIDMGTGRRSFRVLKL